MYKIKFVEKLHLGSYEYRVKMGAIVRPQYGYCVYNAAKLAKSLGYPGISVIEFGVGAGHSFADLKYHARETAKATGIRIEVFGFDTGKGLPKPLSYKDLPYRWEEGFYKMSDSAKSDSDLILGDIRHTLKSFFAKPFPSPIGAIMFDLDYYSSTMAAFKILDVPEVFCLPRIFCYFDDIIGSEAELYNDYTGVRLAINEFNQSNKNIKIGQAYHFLTRRVKKPWHHQIRICHLFKHSRYNDFVGR